MSASQKRVALPRGVADDVAFSEGQEHGLRDFSRAAGKVNPLELVQTWSERSSSHARRYAPAVLDAFTLGSEDDTD